MAADTLSPDLVGTQFEPVQISWTQKDTMLYALGVGSKPADELDFVYEGKGPLVLPTYAVIPGMRALGNIPSSCEAETAAIASRRTRL